MILRECSRLHYFPIIVGGGVWESNPPKATLVDSQSGLKPVSTTRPYAPPNPPKPQTEILPELWYQFALVSCPQEDSIIIDSAFAAISTKTRATTSTST